jgi:phosphomannomutase
MKIDSSIFKSYDIRGIYGKNLNEELTEKIGQGFIQYLDMPSTVIVGTDGRISGPVLKKHLLNGLTKIGVSILDIGLVSTDMYYYACAEKQLPGIMITASHNPPEYNGFKMVKQIPYLLSGDEGIKEIKNYIETDQLPPASMQSGKIEVWDIMQEFINKVLFLINHDSIRPFKILADTANGMVGPILKKLQNKIPQLELVPMYWEVDGNFPNHGGDPLQEINRKELMTRVPAENADLGIAFDPDGDRFFVIDKTGRFISGDFMTAILAEYFLARHPGSPIVYDIRASKVVPHVIEKHGGLPLANRIGHTHIKKRMIDEHAVFGGEVTGHYYFSDFYYCDTGIVTLFYLLEYLSQSNQSLDKIIDQMESQYHISGEINNQVASVPDILKKLEEIYGAQANQVIKIDGITCEFDDWRFNVRGSNTEPLIRLNLEANSQQLMEQKRDEVLKIIRGK